MVFRTLECPSCGAPLPPEAKLRIVTCAYCKATVSWEKNVVLARDFAAASGRAVLPPSSFPRVSLAGVPYDVEGKLAEGATRDVFLARRATRMSARVVLHLVREAADEGRLVNTLATLGALERSTSAGAHHFTTLLPQVVASGTMFAGEEALGAGAAYRYRSGFDVRLDALAAAFPGGLDPRHGVWIARRLLELLGFLARSGFAHGAVAPEHVLVHARDHGAMLVGYGAAGAHAQKPKLAHVTPSLRPFVSADVLAGSPLTPEEDVRATARTVLACMRTTDADAAPVVTLLADVAKATVRGSAPEVHALLGQAAERAFGPPRFVELAIPPDLVGT